MVRIVIFFLSVLVVTSCTPSEKLEGLWRAEVPTVIGPVPFHLEFEGEGEALRVFAINGNEKLELDKPAFRNDSLLITMKVFEAEIIAEQKGDELIGIYTKKLGNLEDRTGPFYAKKGVQQRFDGELSNVNISGKWSTTFIEDSGDTYPAIGFFEQNGSDVNGTFLTPTGDYRFLAGNVVDDSLKLSCFDGTHIFLFKAKVDGDSLVGGRFTSSMLYKENWLAVKDEQASLPDPEKLTYLKEGFETLEFSFPDGKGDSISLSDARFKDKVVLVQILGSWCPNCMDESKFYVKWLEEHPDAPVEVLGLAFERSIDPDYAFPKIELMKERFGMKYPIVLAGLSNKTESAKALPMLNKIISFPTTIYIDKSGKVRKIHTGFSGPGTGEYYERFVEDFDLFMTKLMNE
ncbi:peroxiredoxin family protein [Jiulongibacter sp. NS-SX5]|uniref:peroxiredoxin family protein n=1 Tax=Jiulongibacter sp. NS-SX5 TaxID=3463854 RepID=UPI004058AC7C